MIGGAWVFFVSVTALLRFVISRSPTGCVLSPERLPFNSPANQFQQTRCPLLSVYLKQQAPRTTGNSSAQGLFCWALAVISGPSHGWFWMAFKRSWVRLPSAPSFDTV